MEKRTWWQILFRVEPGISLSQWLWDRLTALFPWLVPFVGGVAMTILGGYSEAMQHWGLAGWLASGVAMFVFLALGYWLIGAGRAKHYLARFRRQVQGAGAINPLDRVFDNKRIRVTDLAPPIGGIIEGKSFIDCEIVGPVSAIFDNCDFRGNNGEGVDAMLLHPDGRPKNGFGFRHCTFTRCRFFLITFMVPPDMRDVMMGSGWTGLNWIDGAGLSEFLERAKAVNPEPLLPPGIAEKMQQ